MLHWNVGYDSSDTDGIDIKYIHTYVYKYIYIYIYIHIYIYLYIISLPVRLTHRYVWHDSLTCEIRLIVKSVTWRIDMCDISHWDVWYASFIVGHDLLLCTTWRIYIFDMTRWSVWYDWLTWVARLMDLCATRLIGLECVTWLVEICDVAHCSVGHDSMNVV